MKCCYYKDNYVAFDIDAQNFFKIIIFKYAENGNYEYYFLDFVHIRKRPQQPTYKCTKIESHKYQLPKTNWIHIRRTLDNTQKILKIVYYYYYQHCSGTQTRKHIKHSQIITQFDLSISIPRGVLIFFMVLSNLACHHNAWSTHL